MKRTYPSLAKDPRICWGAVTIKDTRISVAVVVDRFRAGESIDTIMDDYPHVSHNAIMECLRLALDASAARLCVDTYWRRHVAARGMCDAGGGCEV